MFLNFYLGSLCEHRKFLLQVITFLSDFVDMHVDGINIYQTTPS